MLNLRIQKLGNTTIIHCAGQLTFPGADTLRRAVSSQSGVRLLVLDLVDIIAVDAAGLGTLVSLRDWAKGSLSKLKLMNLSPRVEGLLELTNLKSAFEICSAREMLELFCLAIDESESVQLNPATPASVSTYQTATDHSSAGA